MKYIINKSIIFDDEKGVLIHMASKNITTLAVPETRLLIVFLASRGLELSREYLIETVWGQYGAQVSEGNLRQYISILRRHLNAFDCEQLIITLPKIGFKLNNDISICIEGHEGHEGHEGSLLTSNKIMEKLKVKWFSILIIFLFPISIMVAYHIISLSSLDASVSKGNSCNISYILHPEYYVTKEDESKIKKILLNEGLVCSKNNFILFNQSYASIHGAGSRLILSLCTQNADNKVSSCFNYYQYRM